MKENRNNLKELKRKEYQKNNMKVLVNFLKIRD